MDVEDIDGISCIGQSHSGRVRICIYSDSPEAERSSFLDGRNLERAGSDN